MTPAQKQRLKTLITRRLETEISSRYGIAMEDTEKAFFDFERDQAKNALDKYLNLLTEETKNA